MEDNVKHFGGGGVCLSSALLKGTVRIISSDPPCKDGNAWFTKVPFKDLSDQVWSVC